VLPPLQAALPGWCGCQAERGRSAPGQQRQQRTRQSKAGTGIGQVAIKASTRTGQVAMTGQGKLV
jgi:hypothetical protein